MALEIKKNPNVDLNKKRGFIFSISMVITLSMVLFAFEWKQYDSSLVELTSRQTNVFEPMVDVPSTEIPPPPEIIVQQPQLIAVPDEEEIEEEIKFIFDVEVTEDTKVEEYKPVEIPKQEEEESEEIFLVVEENAQPKGGIGDFYKYVSENVKYPAQARRLRVEGRVFVEFIVGKDGKIFNAYTVKGIGAGCDEEAVRIIMSAPAWNPAKQRGKPVKQRMVLPITFKLASSA
jgi:periplasmic protein TonB